MMLLPKRTKYRKHMRGTMDGYETRGTVIEHGTVVLKTIDPGWITSRQIEAARRAMSRSIKRGGKIWIRIFPDHSVTEKAAETRMGSGKGNPEYWVAIVKPGKILFEISGVSADIAVTAMKLAAQKLPVRCLIQRADELIVTKPDTSGV
jgi:large subunit ribosomal protein L16